MNPDESQLRAMFDLVALNMQPISPVPGTPDEIYSGWREAWHKRIREEDVRFILDTTDVLLRGFLSYSVDARNRHIFIDEMQIRPELRQGGVVFRKLVSHFLKDIETLDCDHILTYANKLNPISPKLALKLGFKLTEETQRGWRFSINKTDLCDRLRHIKR